MACECDPGRKRVLLAKLNFGLLSRREYLPELVRFYPRSRFSSVTTAELRSSKYQINNQRHTNGNL